MIDIINQSSQTYIHIHFYKYMTSINLIDYLMLPTCTMLSPSAYNMHSFVYKLQIKKKMYSNYEHKCINIYIKHQCNKMETNDHAAVISCPL
jgi:hypothetical protein